MFSWLHMPLATIKLSAYFTLIIITITSLQFVAATDGASHESTCWPGVDFGANVSSPRRRRRYDAAFGKTHSSGGSPYDMLARTGSAGRQGRKV